MTPEASWAETVRDLPVGTRIAADVVGRRPFGVFLRIDGHLGAVGLADITAMPQGMELPPLGARVTGRVLAHTGHNRQVKIRLTDWG